MPYSELILAACALMQGLLLLLPGSVMTRRAISVLSAAGFLAAAAALALSWDTGAAAWFGMLEDKPLLRLPRAAFFLAGLLLGRSIVSTKELPEGRKREVLFLLTVLALLCDLLILSRHALLSCILLISLSWVGIFLSGLAYRGRIEGEAVLKFWVQASVSLALGFGSVLALAVLSGGASYAVISERLTSLPPYSPEVLFLVLALCLPYFLVGGIFPFHFATLDRDQGLPWCVQLLLTVLVQGATILALWKTGVEVFGPTRTGMIAEGMRALQIAGLAGGFWLALFALSQNNSKRLFSAVLGAQWSAILTAGAMPTALGLSSVSYAFTSAFLWSALLGFTWSSLQEFAGGETMESVFGLARKFRSAGLVLLIALAAPLCVPGFAGLPSVLHLLAAMIEQESLSFLLAEGLLLALLALVCLRIGTDLLFRDGLAPQVEGPVFRYGALDFGAIVLLGITLLGLGSLWHRVFAAITLSAKAFL